MEVRFSKSALKALWRSNKAELIRRKIDEVAADPLSQGANVKRLAGRTEYRLRVQDWRVIFRLEEGVLWIDDIGPRGSIY
ncbi:MAG TPA: type II toxin-antitoxin system RelE/ParE family toxin [Allosphingosinicella sp.]|nr:type II toxin-antitoxin system RelE/ParE family toxin [Allosphingosinicella sp.]